LGRLRFGCQRVSGGRVGLAIKAGVIYGDGEKTEDRMIQGMSELLKRAGYNGEMTINLKINPPLI